MTTRLLVTATLAMTLGLAGLAQAETVKFSGKLSAADGVVSAATGKVWGTLDTDTNMLSYKIKWSGLTGPVVAAHFHGPAAMGKNAGVLVPIEGPFKSGMKGSARVSDAVEKDLLDGMTYVNLHTKANPDGEIRAQIAVTKAMSGPGN